MFQELPDMLTLKQCQKALQLGRNSMLNLIYSGEIRAFKIRGSWRITKEELLRYIKHLY